MSDWRPITRVESVEKESGYRENMFFVRLNIVDQKHLTDVFASCVVLRQLHAKGKVHQTF